MAGGLGLLALGSLGQWGFNQIQGARDDARIAKFDEAMQKRIGGFDMTTPEGFAQGAQALMFDPRTQALGGNMLNQALSRRQDQENVEWGRSNLTKAQQEDLALAQQRVQQDAWEGQQRISQGWAGVDINRQQLGMQAEAARRQAEQDALKTQGYSLDNQLKQATLEGAGLPDPEKVLARENNIRDNYNKAMGGYQERTNAFETTMSTLKESNPIAAVASIYNLAKTLDPKGAVREGDTVMLTSASGPLQALQGTINQLQGGGALTPEVKQQITQTLLAMQSQNEAAAKVTQNYWKEQGGADPALRMPAVNERIYGGYDLDASSKYRIGQPVAGSNGDRVNVPGIGELRKVSK